MKKCGIPCPLVVLLKKHILVMSFIGEGRNPAPKLKDAKLSDAEYELAYDQCVQVGQSGLRYVCYSKSLKSGIL